jgi:hypothetical protein
MAQVLSAANPFGMMLSPEAVLLAVERSELLGNLKRRVCRPLDKPLIPKTQVSELDAFDREIDSLAEDDGEME